MGQEEKEKAMRICFAFLVIAIFGVVADPAYAQKVPKGETYNAVITRVLDGDSVAIEAKWLPAPLKPEIIIRIFGIDTPETGFRAKCPKEAELGLKAKEHVKKAVAQSKDKKVILINWDKYGGRVLGDILLDGKSLRENLIQQKYAREYYGETKQSWCN